jgi:hypothetical protein
MHMVRLLKNYSLSFVLAALFLVSWLLHGLTGWRAYVAQQEEHRMAASFWGGDGYIWEFLEQTFENWQSEFLQLLAMVVLTAFLIHKGSAESRDQSDRMERKIDEIKRALERSK